MRSRFAAVLCLLLSTAARGQEPPKLEELQKMYSDAIEQLKAAQDRKNELASENEKLIARVAELERQLADRDRQIAAFAEKTWYWRSHYAAWETFIERYPKLAEQWRAFLSAGELDPLNRQPVWADPKPATSG